MERTVYSWWAIDLVGVGLVGVRLVGKKNAKLPRFAEAVSRIKLLFELGDFTDKLNGH